MTSPFPNRIPPITSNSTPQVNAQKNCVRYPEPLEDTEVRLKKAVDLHLSQGFDIVSGRWGAVRTQRVELKSHPEVEWKSIDTCCCALSAMLLTEQPGEQHFRTEYTNVNISGGRSNDTEVFTERLLGWTSVELHAFVAGFDGVRWEHINIRLSPTPVVQAAEPHHALGVRMAVYAKQQTAARDKKNGGK